MDWETIGASVRKTNRVIVAYEDSLSWGYGAEIAARIADETFACLDAPVRRVASTDTFVAYAPELEDVDPAAGREHQASDHRTDTVLRREKGALFAPFPPYCRIASRISPAAAIALSTSRESALAC